MSAESSFGMLAKNRRRELGLTQDELARRVGCAPITLRKIEADDLRPSVQIAERMAMALNIPLEERSAFVKLARTERLPAEEDYVTPMPAPEEIGSEDLSGRAIRGYALGERLGHGGMGAVYRAVQPLVEREVAIKIILPKYANHPDFIRRFEAEAQLVARLEHPHIVPLYDYWREPGVAYLIMRLLRGGSVQTLLRTEPTLPPETVLRMMEQVGSALGAAHRAGVVHRDLKPANVLLDEDNNAYLADFGIAKNLSSPSSETQANEVIGSPDYISPEQIRSEFVRPQTDIYALGVMLYELLTGKVPFLGPTPIDVMMQHLNEPLPPLAANRINLPKSLDAVIEHATAKDPLQRYETVEAMLGDLRKALGAGLRGKTNTSLSQPTAIPLADTDNPYKGLRAFGEGDAQDFFGRESLTQQLLVRLGEGGELARFLAVVGPSGSGKSSVVKAGLIPALRRGALPGSENWFIVEMMPGSHPLEELEAALLRVAVNPPASMIEQFQKDSRGLIRAVRRSLPDDPNIELVLVIDQFEEVFTLLQNEKERLHFLGLLVSAVLDENSRIRVVLTLRADFIDRPLGYMDFGELLHQRMEIVLPLTPDELESAIVSPAERVGLHLESGLVTAILRDLGDQPGTLPLLQYALTELYEKRTGNTLTKSAYREIGGVLGALGRRAEEIFTGLTPEGQAIARQLFLRLVILGEGVEDTRRRTTIFELESLHLADVDLRNYSKSLHATLDAFGRARLLSFDRDPDTRRPTAEVAHEAIIREWARLRNWLNESRALVRMQRHLDLAASEWESAQRDESFLLTGAKLAQYEGWTVNSTVALTQHELVYLKASIAERDKRETEEAARLKRELETAQKLAETERSSALRLRLRNRVITSVCIVAIILAMLAGMFGFQSNRNAVTAQNNAATAQVAKEMAFNSQSTAEAERLQTELERKLSFSRELAWVARDNIEVDPERAVLLAMQAISVADTREAITALHLTVPALHLVRKLYGHTDLVSSISVSPDGKYIASASNDKTARIWDAQTGQSLRVLTGDVGILNSVVYSPDGQLLATGDYDGTIEIWEAASGRERTIIPAHYGLVNRLIFSPDGTLLASAGNDAVTRVWDVASGKLLSALSGHQKTTSPDWPLASGVSAAVFSPAGSGRLLVTTGFDGQIILWDLADPGQPKQVLTMQQTSQINWAAFSPDGSRLATGDHNGDVEVWDMTPGPAMGQTILTLKQEQAIYSLAFSPDGKRLAVSDVEKLIVWDAVTSQKRVTLYTTGGGQVVFTPDGKYLVLSSAASADLGIQILDPSPDRELLALECSAPATSVLYSRDGKRIFTGCIDGTLIFWDSSSGEALLTLHEHTDNILNLALSPDGTRLATASWDKTAKIFDSSSGRVLTILQGHTKQVWGLAFSPDGKRLATSSQDGTAKIWDAATGQELLTIQTDPQNTALAFSSDGKRLVTGAWSTENVYIWDASSGQKLSTLSMPGGVNSLASSPDGKQLAISAQALDPTIWDVSSNEGRIKFTLKGHIPNVMKIAYSPDGSQLATAGWDGQAKLWDALTGQELFMLASQKASLLYLDFSPDGSHLAVAGMDGLTRVYTLRLQDLLALARSRLTRSLTLEECQQFLHMDACPAQ